MSSSIPDEVPAGATDAQLRHIINYWRIEAQTSHHRWVCAMEENEVLRKKVEWLQKASDLVIWNGSSWEHRKQILPT